MQDFEFALGQRISRLGLKIVQDDGLAELFSPLRQQVFVAQNNGTARKIGEAKSRQMSGPMPAGSPEVMARMGAVMVFLGTVCSI